MEVLWILLLALGAAALGAARCNAQQVVFATHDWSVPGGPIERDGHPLCSTVLDAAASPAMWLVY